MQIFSRHASTGCDQWKYVCLLICEDYSVVTRNSLSIRGLRQIFQLIRSDQTSGQIVLHLRPDREEQ
jgi:hypothetical protein